MSNEEQPPRRTLRQRVADRKRGVVRKPPMSASQKKKLKILTLGFVTVQYIGLLLLLLGLMDFVSDGYVINNVTLFAVAIGMFMVGRIGPLLMKAFNVFK